MKPDLVAPGVGLATSEPGANADGTSRFGTVNGSSAAAAAVAGAAALLAQARPDLDARALRSLLANTARPLPDASVAAQGAGLLDLGAAAAAEFTADARARSRSAARTTSRGRRRPRCRIRNVSTGKLTLVGQRRRRRGGAAELSFSVQPGPLRPASGPARTSGSAHSRPSEPRASAPAEGVVVFTRAGTRTLRVPWAITFGPPTTGLLGQVRLSARAFRPSDVRPALLTLRAGRVIRTRRATRSGRSAASTSCFYVGTASALGLLARLRDVIPGHVTFGITGRDPEGNRLGPAATGCGVTAWPSERAAPPSRTVVRFRIEGSKATREVRLGVA